MDTVVGKTTLGELLPYIVVVSLLIIFIVFCIAMAIKTSKIKKKQKKELKDLKAQGLTCQITANHTYGLPLAEGLFCKIQVFKDHIDFYSGTLHIKLDNEKIMDMCIKSETEIQQQYVSSVGGAVGGAVLFGPIGAMIGGRAKKKTTKNTTSYFIITYKNADDAIAYLGFDVSGSYWEIKKLVDEFHKNNTQNNIHIEL